MAKAIAVPSERPESKQPSKQPQQPGQLAGTWERSTGFLKDVRNEMRKVSTPSRKEVQATTVVVIVTVFAFAAYFWVVDGSIAFVMQRLLHALGSGQ
jgi:preprotein translocase subunit SecE